MSRLTKGSLGDMRTQKRSKLENDDDFVWLYRVRAARSVLRNDLLCVHHQPRQLEFSFEKSNRIPFVLVLYFLNGASRAD
jgi:hypothetical protein